MKFSKNLCRIISLVLCFSLLLQCVTNQNTAEATEVISYVSDIKVIYAESAKEAEKSVPKGYTLFEQDINEGTDSLGVYLCYATTTDPDQAITDVRVMNEEAGFDRGTFNQKMDQAIKALDGQAENIYKAIYDEFVPNYKAKIPGAVYAHSQLNIFMYDKTNPLGDYIVSGKLTKQDISKMLLVCHNLILSSIMSLISQGLQRADGADWLDRLEKMDPAKYENNLSLQKQYAPLIDQIQPALNQFSDQYNIMVYTEDVSASMSTEQVELYREDLSDENTVQWWYSLWDILNAHTLAGDSGLTAESVLVELYLGESVANHKVCMLIDALTPGQRSLLSLVGPINLIFNDIFTEEQRLKAEKDLAPLKEEQGTVSLWDGVDMDIFTTEVGITGIAYDEMITSNNYDIFTDEKSVLTKTTEDYISTVSLYTSIISGALSVVTGSALLAKGYVGKVLLFKALSKLGVFLTKSLIGVVFSYAPMVVLTLCFFATIIVWIVKEIQANKPPEHERTTIPKYMVDSITDNFGAQKYEIYKRVDNVQSDEELKKVDDFDLDDVKNLCGADINACKGYHWSALYLSRSVSAGNPIEADFKTVKSLDGAPNGYLSLRHFNKKTETANLNAVDEYDSSDEPLYLYYKGTKLPENHTVYKYIRSISVANVSLRDPKTPTKYRFSTNEAINVAKKELTEAGLFVIDYNFSNDNDVVTMIGWSGTNRADSAIKDIRLVKDSSVARAGSGTFGTISYGNVGNVNSYSLFVSGGEQNPAPPITMLKLVKKGEDPSNSEGMALAVNGNESTIDTDGKKNKLTGWEAVNEFTGGRAVPLGNAGAELYFMPEKAFTTGPDYLAGIKMDAYVYNYSFDANSYSYGGAYSCDHVDIWNNSYEKYQAYKKANFDENFYEDSVLETFEDMSANSSYMSEHSYSSNHTNCPYFNKNGYNSNSRLTPHSITSIKYYTTKNPYRAIYGVATRTSDGKQNRDSFVSYDGYGYAISPSEVTVSVANLEFKEWGYSELVKSRKEFVNKTHILKDNTYHSKGIVVNYDLTQFIPEMDTLTINSIYVTGYTNNRTPLQVSDLKFSKDMLPEGAYPDNFTEVPYMGNDGTQYTVLSPFSERIYCCQPPYTSRINAAVYTPFYGYVRSEIKTSNTVTSYMPGTGKYVSALFLASKEKIRTTSLLENDPKAECKNVSYNTLKTSLLGSGATTVFSEGIGTDYYSGGNDNANTVYLGIARTDDPEKAVRDIRFYVCNANEKPEEKKTVTIKKDGKEHTLNYELVADVSLTSKANLSCVKTLNNKGITVWEETELLKERQAYLYVCYNTTAFPDPISEVSINQWCTNAENEPLLNFEGRSFYTVKGKSQTNLHITDEWFKEGTTLSFKRSNNNKKYVSEVTVKNGDDKVAIMTSLVEQGYSVVNKDLNQGTVGDDIYLGVKYTDKEEDAVTNLLTLHSKNHYAAYSVTDEKHIYRIVGEVDLNKRAGGDYIYLYATKDPRAGTPVLEIYGTDSVKEYSDSVYKHTTIQRLWDFKYSNINANTTIFTPNIYLVMKQKSNSGKYISDLYVAYGWSKSGAVEKLRENGYYEYVDKDLNDGTGSSQYVYLGYKRTDDPNKAIRNIAIHLQGDGKAENLTFDGIEYTLASNVNLNRHCIATSEDLFLYYTKDAKAGDPITALYCSSSPVNNKLTELGYHNTVKGEGKGPGQKAYCDLNNGAGGDYIYLVMVSQPASNLISSMFGNGSLVFIAIVGILFALAVVAAIYYRKRKEKVLLAKEKVAKWLKTKFKLKAKRQNN